MLYETSIVLINEEAYSDPFSLYRHEGLQPLSAIDMLHFIHKGMPEGYVLEINHGETVPLMSQSRVRKEGLTVASIGCMVLSKFKLRHYENGLYLLAVSQSFSERQLGGNTSTNEQIIGAVANALFLPESQERYLTFTTS